MPARSLLAVAAPRDDAVLTVLPALSAALRGEGPAVLLHEPGEPVPDVGAGEPLAPGEDDPHDPTVAVVATSGSTGRAKGVLLQASALLASAAATHDRLGGPGRWLLALPVTHVAGLQVLVRGLVARTSPAVCDTSTGFSPNGFAEAAARLAPGPRRYTALVPTQLTRLLEAGGEPLAALAGFDAVLVGGAALPGPLADRAAAAGVRVVTTYGMSETSGGCVYDGVPLDGVDVALDPGLDEGTGRITLAGPVVARGYRGRPADPAFTALPDGTRRHTTQDGGRWEPGPDGGRRLVVLGRLDDVVVTGGVNVAPRAVEAALLTVPGVAEAVAFGVPDERWGRRVVAAVVVRDGAPAPELDAVRAHVRDLAGPAAAPRQLLVLDRLPLLGPGKPDRAELARRAADQGAG